MALSIYQKVAEIVKGIPNDRVRDVVGERFGLWDGEAKTLQAIGDKYKITRERVRQIEEVGLKALNQPYIAKSLDPIYKKLELYLLNNGSLRREDRIASDAKNEKHFAVDLSDEKFLEPALQFCLTLGKPFNRIGEDDSFYTAWTLDKKAVIGAQKFIDELVKYLKNHGQVISQENILKAFSKWSISEKAMLSYIDAAKHIEQNNFGQWGLAHWPEIKLRVVKDKAYVILKKAGKPLHFSEVAKSISDGFALVNTQTVHNELIKDARFVLVGRGLYGLEDWGFEGGTVRDLLVKVIKENGPLTKEQLIDKVTKVKMVKLNTILVNLQNNKYFKKSAEGRYILAK